MTRVAHIEPPPYGGHGPRQGDLPVEVYPSLRAAAKLIGITPAALSRRDDVTRIRAGRETRLPAGEVVRLATIYRRRAPSRVAAELVQRAIAIDPSLEEVIGREVDVALEETASRRAADASIEQFLDAAHRLLPPALAKQVDLALRSDCRGAKLIGWSPPAE